MRRLVIDASAAVELLLVRPAGQTVAEVIADPAVALHAPHLLPVEVASAMRRYVLRHELTADRADQAMHDLSLMDIEYSAHDLLLAKAWELRENVTIYDGVYLALAELLDAPLLTADARLAGAAAGLASVQLV